MGSPAWATPMLSTLAGVLTLLLIASTAPTPVLGTHVNMLQAEALDNSVASGVVVHGLEKTKFTQALGRKILQSPFQCPGGEVQCPSGIQECFQPDSHNCNTYNDCSDGSDEAADYCALESTRCRFPFDKCPSNKCSNSSVFNGKALGVDIFVCDRKTDCPDNSDEDPDFCAGYDCASQGAQRCPGSIPQCMPRISRLFILPSQPTRNRDGGFFGDIPPGVPNAICDGLKDCEDGSDEDPALCFPNATPPPTQGICGTSIALGFPIACYSITNDPTSSYICCDSEGCDGFQPPDYNTPKCKTGRQPPDFVRPNNYPKDVPCPVVGGFASNSCFDALGAFHVCCANPDSCASVDELTGEARCTNDNYVKYTP